MLSLEGGDYTNRPDVPQLHGDNYLWDPLIVSIFKKMNQIESYRGAILYLGCLVVHKFLSMYKGTYNKSKFTYCDKQKLYSFLYLYKRT